MDDIEDRLIELVGARVGRTPAPDDDLAVLGIDSVELAEFVGVLEREFGFEVDQDIFDVNTLASLARYIRERRRGAG